MRVNAIEYSSKIMLEMSAYCLRNLCPEAACDRLRYHTATYKRCGDVISRHNC